MRIAGELTEAHAELLFAHLPVGMAVTDVDDTIRFCDEAGAHRGVLEIVVAIGAAPSSSDPTEA
jgi:hypothetical protein